VDVERELRALLDVIVRGLLGTVPLVAPLGKVGVVRVVGEHGAASSCALVEKGNARRQHWVGAAGANRDPVRRVGQKQKVRIASRVSLLAHVTRVVCCGGLAALYVLKGARAGSGERNGGQSSGGGRGRWRRRQ